VIIFYWLRSSSAKQMAVDGKLPVVAATWGPNLIVGLAGFALLLLRQKRDVFSLSTGSRAWVRALQSRFAASGLARKRRPKAPAEDPDPAVYTTTPAARAGSRSSTSYIASALPGGLHAGPPVGLGPLRTSLVAQSLMDSMSEENQPLSLAFKYLRTSLPGMMKIVTPIVPVSTGAAGDGHPGDHGARRTRTPP
jgi:hypothetical protein